VVYLREAEVLPELDAWLSKSLDPARLPDTLNDLAANHQSAPSPEAEALGEEIRTCTRQLAQYRATLDKGGAPAVVGQWITETQARKLAAEARLAATRPATPRHMTKEQITALVNTITNVVTVLRDADRATKLTFMAS
jgi:site-specific DNA recombinase